MSAVERGIANPYGEKPAFKINAGAIIVGLLTILCCLAAFDTWTQYTSGNQDYWSEWYSLAIRSDQKLWEIGFRIEDVQIRAERFRDTLETKRALMERVHVPNVRSHSKAHPIDPDAMVRRRGHIVELNKLVVNTSNIFTISCGSYSGSPLRVGYSDYLTTPETACRLFNGLERDAKYPHYMFEQVPTDEGSFALRSLASNTYVTTIPPAHAKESTDYAFDFADQPWHLAAGSPTLGVHERFRLTDDNLLYSSILRGFFQCSNSDNVRGFSSQWGSYSGFYFNPVSASEYDKAMEMASLSRSIGRIQTKYVESHHDIQAEARALERHHLSQQQELNSKNKGKDKELEQVGLTKIALCIPVTSKNTVMEQVSDSPLWSNFFDSFMKSIDWRGLLLDSNKFQYRVYIGFDKADDVYDTGDAWSEMRAEFHSRAEFRMKEQQMSDADVARLLHDDEGGLSLKLMHFDDLHGAPSQVVSQLVLQAYADGFDYFYQVNDDTSFTTPNWAPELVNVLRNNPLIPNFGVTGPLDVNNDKIFTHSFTHRTHIDVFGYLFPPFFRNWWSDDWISTVYGASHTFRSKVQIRHNVEAQKTRGFTRYDVDHSDKLHLDDELRDGHVQIDRWLKKNGHPRATLPNVCGYIPLVKHLVHTLEEKAEEARHMAPDL